MIREWCGLFFAKRERERGCRLPIQRHPSLYTSVLLPSHLLGFSGDYRPANLMVDLCLLCRGDIPFCTEECRREQIEMDEEMERKESTPKKVAPRAPSPKDVESPPRPPKARAGSILAG